MELQSGEVKAISAVRVGDRVRAASMLGETLFSEVVAVPHGANSVEATFTRLVTATGRDIKLSESHLLLAGPCGSRLALQQARDVAVGMCLQTVAGQERVTAAGLVQSTGLYSFVVKAPNSLVAVNGVIASPFALNHGKQRQTTALIP